MEQVMTDQGRSPRRRRNPDRTRNAILEAAGKLLAKDGPEGLSVSQVAQLAGVNRGTAYQHFQSREQLVEATKAWVSERLCEVAFGDFQPSSDDERLDPRLVSEHLIEFLMDNPELGRVWLFDVLSSQRPSEDPFWSLYRSYFQKFAESELAEPGIDCDVHAVVVLMGTFLWPVWARAHARTAKEKTQMAKRFSTEMLRMSLHGTMRPEKFADLDANLKQLFNGS
ncbi:TetR/AcrR family transcriptional regulator [uncultured Abyssibacter sp.]|uniref:TetR/AcrR family transcriptional regulator n=1 Tax=uncultured Abyssibacter sp. TaxID=2320202 RepID=UPI0032B1D26B